MTYERVSIPTVSVIEPPAPLLTASEVRDRLGISDGDAILTPLIRAVCASIEPPYGWVGRAFMLQTLEQRGEWFATYWGSGELRLRFPPIRSVESIKYLDTSGAEQTLDTALYDVLLSTGRVSLAFGSAWPDIRAGAEAVRVRYVAGHNADDPWLENAKAAVALAVRELLPLASRDPALSAVNVPGVGSQNYIFSDASASVLRGAVDRLLQGYRVWN